MKILIKNLYITLLIFFQFYFGQKIEYFSDNKNVVKKNQYKIDVRQYNDINKNFSIVKFNLFQKKNSKWILIQKYSFQKEKGFYLDVVIDEDLNNDGFNDLKISFAAAARGANEINKLFIFNPNYNSFINIINSQDYPNLHYNKRLNNINSYAFYGGCGTTFLKLDKNKLKKFARIDYSGDSVFIYKVVNNKEIFFKKRSYKTNDAAVFFSNYNPLEQ